MIEAPQIQIRWRARHLPLAPIAVGAQGDVAIACARRLLALDDESLAKLKGVAGQGLLLVLGEEELLPWVDGVTYLGRDDVAPALLVPTTVEPEVPIALLERALVKRLSDAAPIAVFIDPPILASVSLARPISRETLVGWLNSENSESQAEVLTRQESNHEGHKEHEE